LKQKVAKQANNYLLLNQLNNW